MGREPSNMKLSDLTGHAGEWLRGTGPMSDIVISSRIRLARNVMGYPFLTKCSRPERQSLEHRVRDVILASGVSPQTFYVDLENAPQVDRDLLVERHLISKPHASADGSRGVAVGESETSPSWFNEEDTSASRSSAPACSSKRPGTRSTRSTTSSRPSSTGRSTPASAT